jgi:diguanylate cyclase (GGDEF)-like protein
LNALLHSQTGHIVDSFKQSAKEISNGREMESLFSDDPVSHFFAEKDLLSYFNSAMAVHPYLKEIRIQKGNRIIFSSSENPLQIDTDKSVCRTDNVIYRIVRNKTLVKDTYLLYIVCVNDFLFDFNSLHNVHFTEIAYVIDKTWAVVFGKEGNSAISSVEKESDLIIIIDKNKFSYSWIESPHLVQIVVALDNFYKNIIRTALILVLFIALSGFFLFVIIKFISRSLTQPIRELSEYASSAHEGHFPQFRYEGKVVDEVKTLMSSFNYMTREISNFTEKLELEVINRTRVIEDQKNSLKKLNEELEMISVTDKLTGLFNRRYFDEIITRDFDLAARTNLYIGLGIVDIDFFKEINDTFGHLCGDEILKDISGLMISVFRRDSDILFRFGGDEFIILTLNKEDRKPEFHSLCETLRARVEDYSFPCNAGMEELHVTISTGLYFGRADQVENYQEIIKAADKMLYKVKGSGRNKVFINE